MRTALKILRLFVIAICVIHGSARAQECADGFASTAKPAAFTSEEHRKLASFCADMIATKQVPMMDLTPRQLFFAALECRGHKYDMVSHRVKREMLVSRNAHRLPETRENWRALRTHIADFEGVPPEVLSTWKANALSKLKEDFERVTGPANTQSARDDFLYSLTVAKPFLSEAEIKENIRSLASATASGLARQYPGVNNPKLFQLVKESIRRDLNLEYKELTDLVAVNRPGAVEMKILAVNPFPGEASGKMNEGIFVFDAQNYGFYDHEPIGSVLGDAKVKWKTNGRKYEGKYKIVLGRPVTEVAPAMEQLDYKGLWADKKLTGMVFPGANMGVGEGGAHEVMDEYRAYYRSKGYKFARPKPIKDFQEFLKGETESGRLDYLLKEEHSAGGDTRFTDLIRIGKLLTGTKKLAGGKEEVIHIFYPNETMLQESRGEPMPHQAVADWMKARTSAGGKQLFYADTSCSGIGMACKLASVVQDKNLVVAGSDDQLSTFSNDPESPVYHLLEGLRGKKNFAQIRQAMSEQNSQQEGLYLLPHSEDWKATMHHRQTRAMDIQIQVTENGKPVDIETVGR